MKTSVRLPLIAILASLLPSVAAAQRTPTTDSAAIGGEIGVFRPDADALDPALTLDGFYEYYVSPRTSLRLGLGWTSPEYAFDPDESLRYVRFGGDIIYNWEGGTIHPFVGAGLGVYILQRREDGEVYGYNRQPHQNRLSQTWQPGSKRFGFRLSIICSSSPVPRVQTSRPWVSRPRGRSSKSSVRISWVVLRTSSESVSSSAPILLAASRRRACTGPWPSCIDRARLRRRSCRPLRPCSRV